MMFKDRFTQYTLGHDDIDEQHWELYEVVNKILATYIVAGVSIHQLQHLLDLLAEHFTSEELIMDQVGYPYKEAHKELHETLIIQVKLLIEHSNNVTNRKTLVDRLEEILTVHIDGADRSFVNWIKTNL